MEEFYSLIIGLSDVEELFKLFDDDNKNKVLKKYLTSYSDMRDFCEFIKTKEDDKDLERFAEKLSLLYPLSKELILEMTKEQIKCPKKNIVAYLRNNSLGEGFYVAMKKNIEELYKETEGNNAVKDMKEEVETLGENVDRISKEIAELKNNAENDEIKRLKEEYERLKEEKRQLEKETDREELEAEIEKLSEEKKKLEKLIENKKEEKETLVKALEDLDIEEIDGEEKKAIETLVKLWKEDHTEE